jgi:hypothetical protein
LILSLAVDGRAIVKWEFSGHEAAARGSIYATLLRPTVVPLVPAVLTQRRSDSIDCVANGSHTFYRRGQLCNFGICVPTGVQGNAVFVADLNELPEGIAARN